MMGKKSLTKESKALFPLRKIDSVVELFKQEIGGSEPNLAILSIILGAVEHSLVGSTKPPIIPIQLATPPSKPQLFKEKKSGQGQNPDSKLHTGETAPAIATVNGNGVAEATSASESEVKNNLEADNSTAADFPPLELDIVLGLYDKFQTILITSINRTLYAQKQFEEAGGKLGNGTSVDLIKNVSDIVWNTLSKSYNADRPHLQSLYTYLTGHKLDSFGVAVAVVAGAQILDLDDVHLALSEDHSWVTFGLNGELDLEVTWHGKGVEDKRGIPVGLGEDEHSWLYLNGSPVMCDRHMEVAAIVAAMNPTINTNVDSKELSLLQQKLLWVLYDAGHLKKYPMAIGNLAELEDISRTPSRVSCVSLFEEAITSAKTYYANKHVYPYIYYGGYLYKHQEFKNAIICWADAADVMRNYRFTTRNDEEIYTQFLEITKDNLKSIMKQSSSGISATSILRDPSCFATLLRFFDGICQWEENSQLKSLVHSIWTRGWLFAVGKFEPSIRKEVTILCRKANENGEKNLFKTEETSQTKQAEETDVNGNKKEIIRPDAADSVKDTRGSDYKPHQFTVEVTSCKMCDLKDLVQMEKLNTSTMALILTAQLSTAPSKVVAGINGTDSIGSRKRKERNQSLTEELTTEGTESDVTPVRAPPRKRGRKSLAQ